MELAFTSKQLRDICENNELAITELSAEVAEQLVHRLADLRAATNILDLVVGNIRQADYNDAEISVLDLTHGFTIIFRPNHSIVPMNADNTIDWKLVYRIQILGILNNHEQ